MTFSRQHLRSEYRENIIAQVKDKCGIYKIILSSKKSEGISRLIGNDVDSIMYIGHAKSKNSLLKRIRDFYDSASNINENGEPPTTHQAGRYYQIHLKAHLGDALSNLSFEFIATASDEEAINLECAEIKGYLEKHGELPPLNHQLPKGI